MSDLNLALALLGGITLALSLGAGLLKSHGYLPSETIIALLFGVVIGPRGLDVLHCPGVYHRFRRSNRSRG